jgi:hypothetical protein
MMGWVVTSREVIKWSRLPVEERDSVVHSRLFTAVGTKRGSGHLKDSR